MVDLDQVLDTLNWHLSRMPGGLPMAPPNVTFTPPSNGRYVIPSFLPNRPIAGLIRFETEADQQGLFQVLLVWDLKDGLVRATAFAQAIQEHFKRGSVIVRNGPAVRIIEDPWQSGVVSEPNRMMIPVTIPWIVYA